METLEWKISFQYPCDLRNAQAVELGGGGSEEAAATEITWFFGQDAHDSSNGTWERTFQNKAVGVISKTRK